MGKEKVVACVVKKKKAQQQLLALFALLSHLKLGIVEVDAVVGVRHVDGGEVELGQAGVQHGHEVVREQLGHLSPQLLRGQPRPQDLLLRRRRQHGLGLRGSPGDSVFYLRQR